jgi:hypothetical protein
MSKEEEYRRLADQCLMLANKSDNRRSRAILLHMAEVWLRLADQQRSIGLQGRQIIRRTGAE